MGTSENTVTGITVSCSVFRISKAAESDAYEMLDSVFSQDFRGMQCSSDEYM